MNDTRDFLTQGPKTVTVTSHPALGIKFINSGSFELIGEIVQVVEMMAYIKDPFFLSRDPSSVNKFNFIPLNKMNPVVGRRIQLHLSAISLMCEPEEPFIKNYLVARTGLVTAVNIPVNIRDIGTSGNGQ